MIGDPRNDEHLIIAQLQLLFIQFHNAVAAGLPGDLTGEARLRAAQRTVRRHYQWIVLHELLDHVLGDLAHEVRASGGSTTGPRTRSSRSSSRPARTASRTA